MKGFKEEYVRLVMTREEAEKFVMLMDAVNHSAPQMPQWAKKLSVEYGRHVDGAVNAANGFSN